MAKKCSVLIGIMMIFSACAAIWGRSFLEKIPLATAKSVNECANLKVFFSESDLVNDAESMKDWDIPTLYDEDECIAIVKVEKVEIAAAQEVNQIKVLKTIKGNVRTREDNSIELVTENSMTYTVKPGHVYQSSQMSNALREGKIYMIAFNSFNSDTFRATMKKHGIDKEHTYIENMGWYAHLCLNNEKDYMVLESDRIYKFGELMDTEFFTCSKDTYKAWLSMKKKIFHYYLGKDYQHLYLNE